MTSCELGAEPAVMGSRTSTSWLPAVSVHVRCALGRAWAGSSAYDSTWVARIVSSPDIASDSSATPREVQDRQHRLVAGVATRRGWTALQRAKTATKGRGRVIDQPAPRLQSGRRALPDPPRPAPLPPRQRPR